MKRQTALLSVPSKVTQWTLALSTLWAMLRVALRTLYIVALVISWSFVSIEAVALVFTMHVSCVSQSCAYTYGRHTASQDRVAMRLRLGYKYFWEVSASLELNPKYRREDDLIPKNNFHSTRHTPLQTQNLKGKGHILRWMQHLYPMTEEQNQRSERSITTLAQRTVQGPQTPQTVPTQRTAGILQIFLNKVIIATALTSCAFTRTKLMSSSDTSTCARWIT
ncbi:hypothetical protein E2C01_046539 [Portunus trituberculatus]|uniref:Uncharacterized protein n=1 Tax=Portunus trituberculatus TaxID=210409 RepID=A0A5B7G611_PORTR|nr:hypothetical protein [Portunus trituberculatus]